MFDSFKHASLCFPKLGEIQFVSWWASGQKRNVEALLGERGTEAEGYVITVHIVSIFCKLHLVFIAMRYSITFRRV